jgi:hypothetical protein
LKCRANPAVREADPFGIEFGLEGVGVFDIGRNEDL